MKIGISGAQSTGKTTLLQKLQLDPQFRNFKFFTEITRDIQKQGLPINKEGNDRTQLAIMQAHRDRLTEPGNAIYDRTSLDGLVYTHYLFSLGKVTQETLRSAFETFSQTINKYQLLIYTEPSIPIMSDGVRDTDTKFRDTIIHLFDSYIQHYALPIVIVRGSVEERLSQVKGVVPYGL